jgi:Bacterial trigger factor protein (TF)
MEVTETLSDGLKREFQVQVPAADLEARVAERLGELKDRVQLRGFRPGKVPVTHLRKIYGKAVMAETIEAVIRELNAKCGARWRRLMVLKADVARCWPFAAALDHRTASAVESWRGEI